MEKISNIQNEQNMFWNDFGIKGVVPKLKRGGCQYQNHYQIIFSLVNLSEKMLTKIAKYGIQYSTTLWNTLNVQSHFLFYCFFKISLSFLALSNSVFSFFYKFIFFFFSLFLSFLIFHVPLQCTLQFLEKWATGLVILVPLFTHHICHHNHLAPSALFILEIWSNLWT